MKNFLKPFCQEEQGQDLVEYALTTGIVAIAAVAASPALHNMVNIVFAKIATIIESTVS